MDHRLLFSQLVKNTRHFFDELDFNEVITPAIVKAPTIEPHIHPFKLFSAHKDKALELYLQTSPEFSLKEIIAVRPDNYYSLGHSFRDEPRSPIHREQFTMLEWYRGRSHYHELIKDIELLIKYTYFGLLELGIPQQYRIKDIQLQIVTVKELVKEFCSFDIDQYLAPTELKKKLEKDFKDLTIKGINENSYEDLFFTLFLNHIEPKLKNYPFLVIDQYPAPLKALATVSTDQKYCHRFEFYIHGIEIANAYQELLDAKEQKKRMDEFLNIKKDTYNYNLPKADNLIQALKQDIPQTSGIALGLERFFSALTSDQRSFFWD